MRLSRFITDSIKKFSIQIVLLILISLAMLQFLAVSLISYNVLKEVGVKREIVELFFFQVN